MTINKLFKPKAPYCFKLGPWKGHANKRNAVLFSNRAHHYFSKFQGNEICYMGKYFAQGTSNHHSSVKGTEKPHQAAESFWIHRELRQNFLNQTQPAHRGRK